MPLPEHTHALLYAGGDWRLPGDDNTSCEGSKFHSPTPLFVSPVRLVPEQWSAQVSAQVSPRVSLCGTCRDNLAILQQIMFSRNGQVPWQVRREFGNTIRALADRGWQIYCRATIPQGASDA
jgi:hypothetical protein